MSLIYDLGNLCVSLPNGLVNAIYSVRPNGENIVTVDIESNGKHYLFDVSPCTMGEFMKIVEGSVFFAEQQLLKLKWVKHLTKVEKITMMKPKVKKYIISGSYI